MHVGAVVRSGAVLMVSGVSVRGRSHGIVLEEVLPGRGDMMPLGFGEALVMDLAVVQFAQQGLGSGSEPEPDCRHDGDATQGGAVEHHPTNVPKFLLEPNPTGAPVGSASHQRPHREVEDGRPE